MKGLAVLILCVLLCEVAPGQTVEVIVPKQVVAGNAFQVQFIIKDPANLVSLSTPRFQDLRLISGPNHYKGNTQANGKIQDIENISYTLVPLKEGIVRIHGVTADFKEGIKDETDEISILVLPQPSASFNASSNYTDLRLYSPSSTTDLDELIEQNLFIKAEVDKAVCYIGEVITATFTLYSRLQSTSEVINAPSFYGFSVMDVLPVNEAHQSVKTVNGKVFNTSVLRKLQLYPAQTGKLVVDPMQLRNEIEFDDSLSGKKFKVDRVLQSREITVSVKPLPPGKPNDFSGAVGNFAIEAQFHPATIPSNSVGNLIVTVSGNGNFLQFSPPAVSWPPAMEVLEPTLKGEYDRNFTPVRGHTQYTFSFTSTRTGRFDFLPVSFSFFDLRSGTYRTIHSDSLNLEIIPASSNPAGNRNDLGASANSKWSWWLFILVPVAIILTVLILGRWKKKTVSSVVDVPPRLLQEFRESSRSTDGQQTYLQIQKTMKKIETEYRLTDEQLHEIRSIKDDCQLFLYSDIDVEKRKDELKRRTEKLIIQIDKNYSAYL